jgi:hypothetical protein
MMYEAVSSALTALTAASTPAADVDEAEDTDAAARPDDAAAAERAFSSLGSLGDILHAALTHPFGRIGSGALGAADRRRLMEDGIVDDGATADDLVEIAERTGLLSGQDKSWLVTPAGAQWLHSDTIARWSAVAAAFLEGCRADCGDRPAAGSRPPRGRRPTRGRSGRRQRRIFVRSSDAGASSTTRAPHLVGARCIPRRRGIAVPDRRPRHLAAAAERGRPGVPAERSDRDRARTALAAPRHAAALDGAAGVARAGVELPLHRREHRRCTHGGRERRVAARLPLRPVAHRVPQPLAYEIERTARTHGMVRVGPDHEGRTRVSSDDEALLRTLAVDQALRPSDWCRMPTAS